MAKDEFYPKKIRDCEEIMSEEFCNDCKNYAKSICTDNYECVYEKIESD